MKKILIIATAILVFILLLIFALNSMRRSQEVPNETQITPTTVPFNTKIDNVVDNVALTPIEIQPEVVEAAKSISPFETDSFIYEYSPEVDRIIVTEKTLGGQTDFEQWITANGLPELAQPNNSVIYDSLIDNEMVKDPEPLLKFFDIFLNFGQSIFPVSAPAVTPTPAPAQSSSSSSSGSSSNLSSNSQPNVKYTYYAQCNGYGNIPLPSGCNVCEAGCGPTTVAMIAASYLGNQYNPKTIVDLYDEKGYYLSCAGSRYSDAKAALEGLGLKTTSYLTYNFDEADVVASDFKKYIDAGWTIFTLANYCDKGCGHYFWVTEVQDGKILAYDPYYGKSTTPPYNENSRYPFPKYRLAFGVKK